jgi:hypothetical protein
MNIKNLSLMLLLGLFVSCGNPSSSSTTEKKYPQTVVLEEREVNSEVQRPTVDNPTTDDVFNTRIEMVNKSDSEISNYPKVQTWNSDMTLMRIGSRLYDANTLKESHYTKKIDNPYTTLCSRNSDYFRWSNNDSSKFFLLNSSNDFIEGEINQNDIDCSNVLESFSDYEVLHLGPHEGNIDQNDRYIVFSAKKRTIPPFTSYFMI